MGENCRKPAIWIRSKVTTNYIYKEFLEINKKQNECYPPQTG